MYQPSYLSNVREISEVVEAASTQHDDTQVDVAVVQIAMWNNVGIVFAKTYFS